MARNAAGQRICTGCGSTGPFEKKKDRPNTYRSRCRACLIERLQKWAKEWAITHRDRLREANAEWRSANKDYLRRKYLANREQTLARTNRNKRRLRAGRYGVLEDFTHAEWLTLLARYGNRCICCGKPQSECAESLAADHVIPLSQGGSGGIDNIQPLCNSCNGRKGRKNIDYRRSLEQIAEKLAAGALEVQL